CVSPPQLNLGLSVRIPVTGTAQELSIGASKSPTASVIGKALAAGAGVLRQLRPGAAVPQTSSLTPAVARVRNQLMWRLYTVPYSGSARFVSAPNFQARHNLSRP